MSAPTVSLVIDGKLTESRAAEWRDVVNPANQAVLARVPMATPDEVNAAVASAKKALETWRFTPIGARARVFLKYQGLIREHLKEIAALLTKEQGKTLADAEGDVFRGLEVVEHAANIGTLQMGELANNVATGVDTYTVLQPLGVSWRWRWRSRWALRSLLSLARSPTAWGESRSSWAGVSSRRSFIFRSSTVYRITRPGAESAGGHMPIDGERE